MGPEIVEKRDLTDPQIPPPLRSIKMGRCPRCRMPDVEAVRWHSRKCLNCGHVGFEEEFAIRDLGKGVPPENCPLCNKPWVKDDAATRSCSNFKYDALLYRMYCPDCKFEKYYTVELRDPAFILTSRKDKWSFETPCDAVRLYGHHQYKRRTVDGHYENRCLSCGAPKDPRPAHRYLTVLGVVEHALLFRNTVPDLDPDSYDEDPSDTEVFAKPREVYDCRFREDERRYDDLVGVPRGSFGPPTAKLPDGKRLRDRQYRAIIRHEELEEAQRARESKLSVLLDRIKNYCDGRMEQQDLQESLVRIHICLQFFDRIGLNAGKTLSDRDLESLAAAATYYYIPDLTQEQVCSAPTSVFPRVSRPTLNTWRALVDRAQM